MIGNIIKEARLRKKLRLVDVAEVLGVSFQNVSRYEHNLTQIPSDKLVKLCELLGITPNDALGVTNKPQGR